MAISNWSGYSSINPTYDNCDPTIEPLRPMTPREKNIAELRKVKAGDTIEGEIGDKWVPVVVVKSFEPENPHVSPSMKVRRVGKTKAGSKYPQFTMYSTQLRLGPNYSPLTGNVFADYLEERGYGEAAEVLRKAFPIGEG